MTAADRTLSLAAAKDPQWWLPSDLKVVRDSDDDWLSNPTRNLDHAAGIAYRLGKLLAAIDPTVPGSAEACEYGIRLAETLRHDLLLCIGEVDCDGSAGADQQPPLAPAGAADGDPATGVNVADHPVDVVLSDPDDLPGVVDADIHSFAPSSVADGRSVEPLSALGSASSVESGTNGGAL